MRVLHRIEDEKNCEFTNAMHGNCIYALPKMRFLQKSCLSEHAKSFDGHQKEKTQTRVLINAKYKEARIRALHTDGCKDIKGTVLLRREK